MFRFHNALRSLTNGVDNFFRGGPLARRSEALLGDDFAKAYKEMQDMAKAGTLKPIWLTPAQMRNLSWREIQAHANYNEEVKALIREAKSPGTYVRRSYFPLYSPFGF